ncbi:hypothetical protein Hanom_Chr09g00854471 [Helianthus anomalus]
MNHKFQTYKVLIIKSVHKLHISKRFFFIHLNYHHRKDATFYSILKKNQISL